MNRELINYLYGKYGTMTDERNSNVERYDPGNLNAMPEFDDMRSRFFERYGSLI